MAAASSGDRRPMTGINVTPMVDIMLVLLVIFMVTSSAMSAAEAIEIDRPDARSGAETTATPTTLVVTCDAQGAYFVDATRIVDDDALATHVRAVLARDSTAQAILRCDRRASVDALVHLLDVLRVAGVTRYAIATEPVDDLGAPTR